MGTPRQGALVPSGRGFVQLRIPVECIEGLESYSHAWIIFTFHANTDTPTATTIGSATNTTSSKLNFSKTKIRPPRGNGIKVGMLATRSPHRPNNVGLSLVKISGVDKKEKRLHIQALDLVNGTPVYGEYFADIFCRLFLWGILQFDHGSFLIFRPIVSSLSLIDYFYALDHITIPICFILA